MNLTIQDGSTSRVVEVATPQLLSDLFFLHSTPLAMPCGGRGRCKKCRMVVKGAVSPPEEAERAALGPQALAGGVRLACMTTLLGDAQVTLPRTDDAQVLTQGQLPDFPHAPLGSRLGLAVDIGTTTLAAYLYDLPRARLLATATALNPQGTYGADVISRMQKAHEGQGAELAAAIRSGIDRLVGQLCQKTDSQRQEIDAAVLTGNTAMEYLLAQERTDDLIQMPFHAHRVFGEFLPPAALDLELPGCQAVYLTRCIASYVGGDITMASMAAELYRRTEQDGPLLLVDIGTNGEMVLSAGGKLWCCSTAAGPTFEGAGISMGMTARPGAISRVALEAGEFSCQVIGNVAATGICGSGIIDAVAALLDAGVVDETGCMQEQGHGFTQYLCTVDERTAFRLPGTQVVLTQGDVRAVQLAKAAICAGLLTLLHEAGLDGQVVPLKIAGGFGSFIGVEAAQRVGLIPPGYGAAAQAIGNAAGAGACMLLQSQPLVEASEAMSRRMVHVELATSTFFIQNYTNGMLFPEQEGQSDSLSGVLLTV